MLTPDWLSPAGLPSTGQEVAVKAIPVLSSEGRAGVGNAGMEVAVGEHVSDTSTGRSLQVASHYGAFYDRFAYCLKTRRMQT